MTKLVKILALALGLGLFTAGLATITSSPAPAVGFAPVNIAQVSVASVPVSGTVNVGNTPNVNVANTPNFNVANTPSVNVANTPTVNFAAGSSVNVSNPLDASHNPTPLATLDASQPYEDSCFAIFQASDSAQCSFKAISPGRRLVIQEVDLSIQVASGLKPIIILVFPNGGQQVQHMLTATFMGTSAEFGTQDFFATHQETRLYAGPNATPSCFVHLNQGTNTGGFTCALSGFLVDVPI
jgi:hypothetical protein